MSEEHNFCDKFNKNMGTKAFNFERFLTRPLPGEEVVISGISGLFPDSQNIYQLRDNLYNKVDMITSDDRRWKDEYPDLPHRTGKIFDVDKLDAGFFGLHYSQAEAMDPQIRLILERAVEAILDAGINPSELEGTKTGVYVAVSLSENEIHWYFHSPRKQHYIITGNERSMIANRISFYLKLAGPSYIIDTACSSALNAIEQANKDIRTEKIDMAIVCSTHLTLHPNVALQIIKLGVLSKDGTCKVFDDRADGYTRSEAIVCIILQKAKDCRRSYSEVLCAKVGFDGYKPQGINYPSGEAHNEPLQECYNECDVDLRNLSFLEAHGTGTSAGDLEELQVLDQMFGKKRTTPLLIGSVKSNMGHSEPSSGLCSIAKVIIAMENGLIPPNLHYQTPRRGIEALEKGRLKVVTEKTPFQNDNGLIGINSFGFGGTIGHILLRGNLKTKTNKGLPKDNLPRLVCVSGRLKSSGNLILDDLKNRTLDVEYVKLLHQIFNKNIPGFFFRTYTIIGKSGEVVRSSSCFCDQKKPLCLAFTSFGKSWSKIANQLYVLPLFAKSVQKIHDILLLQKVNVIDLVLNGGNFDKGTNFKEILTTTILQIAIADILIGLEIKPDYYFGLDFGDTVGGYLEGLLSLEETLSLVYETVSDHSGILVAKKQKVSNSKCLSNLTDLTSQTVILELGSLGLNISNKTHHLLTLNKMETVLINFLDILGQLYQFGQNFPVDRLYPEVQYPVSRGTPMISPLISWDHRKNWFVPLVEHQSVVQGGQKHIDISINEENWVYLKGHLIDGDNLFPITGYLFLAWETFSMASHLALNEMQIVMENCKFLKTRTLSKDTKFQLTVTIQKGTGNFEIVDNDTVLATGTIKTLRKDIQKETKLQLPSEEETDGVIPLKTKDIYKELRIRGYNYA